MWGLGAGSARRLHGLVCAVCVMIFQPARVDMCVWRCLRACARADSRRKCFMKLIIRKMRKDDAPALHLLLSDPKVMRYLEAPYSKKQTDHFLCSAGLSDSPLIYAVEEHEKFIGYVIYHSYDHESMEIGWVLFPAYWGRGYASALTDQLIWKAQQEQKDVVIECVPQQTATKQIARKKGFSYKGICDGLEVYRLEH